MKLSQRFNVTVTYTSSTAPIIVKYSNITLTLTLGFSTMQKKVGNTTTTVSLPTVARIVEGKTYVPFRVIAENLGFTVTYYDNPDYVIVISSAPLSATSLLAQKSLGKSLSSVVKGINSITSKNSNTRTINRGSTFTLSANDFNFNPTDAGCKRLLYSSANSSIATVTSQGKVTGVKGGSTTIVIKTHNGKTTSIPVTVIGRNVSLRFDLGKSYCTEYQSNPPEITNTKAHLSIPFARKWGISFDPGYFILGNMPIENCPLHYNTACNTVNCGSRCVNSDTSNNHHKNFNYNAYQAWKNPKGAYQLRMTVVAGSVCHINGTTHGTTALGMASGTNAMVRNDKSRGHMLNVRVMQHEISHQFGCFDHQCTPNQACIMSGGFDANCNFELSNIWCENCQSKFDVNKKF